MGNNIVDMREVPTVKMSYTKSIVTFKEHYSYLFLIVSFSHYKVTVVQ